MSQSGTIIYNACCLVCSLFVLEHGADKFIDHTAIVAKKVGVSQSIVALLTAGAEWEEVRSRMEVCVTRASDGSELIA